MKAKSTIQAYSQPSTPPEPRFNKVILVDDSDVDLFISETIINALRVAKSVNKLSKPEQVLFFLENVERLSDVPELIFLDLNMPGMDGFKFLDEFSKLSDFVRSKCKIIVISSTVDPVAKHRALMYPSVVRFLSKPLDVFQLKDFISH